MDSPPRGSSNRPGNHNAHNHQRSTSDLLSSAKVVAGAAQSTFRHETFDKGQVAEAAEDLLAAASRYGKLEGGGFGNYLEKAEGYLHNYHSSHSTHSSATAHSSSSSTHSTARPQSDEGHFKKKPSNSQSEEEGGSGGGYGEYLKMAQGYLKKKPGNSESEEEGGVGDYFKMAEGFLKKR